MCFDCGPQCRQMVSIRWGSFKGSVCYPDWKGCETLHFCVHNDTTHYCSFCPSAAMCEMIKIMQEYGEVTCCLGSSANLRNSCLFLQSDIRWGRVCSSSSCLCLDRSKYPAMGHTTLNCAGRCSQFLCPFLAAFPSKREIWGDWMGMSV